MLLPSTILIPRTFVDGPGAPLKDATADNTDNVSPETKHSH